MTTLSVDIRGGIRLYKEILQEDGYRCFHAPKNCFIAVVTLLFYSFIGQAKKRSTKKKRRKREKNPLPVEKNFSRLPFANQEVVSIDRHVALLSVISRTSIEPDARIYRNYLSNKWRSCGAVRIEETNIQVIRERMEFKGSFEYIRIYIFHYSRMEFSGTEKLGIFIPRRYEI